MATFDGSFGNASIAKHVGNLAASRLQKVTSNEGSDINTSFSDIFESTIVNNDGIDYAALAAAAMAKQEAGIAAQAQLGSRDYSSLGLSDAALKSIQNENAFYGYDIDPNSEMFNNIVGNVDSGAVVYGEGGREIWNPTHENRPGTAAPFMSNTGWTNPPISDALSNAVGGAFDSKAGDYYNSLDVAQQTAAQNRFADTYTGAQHYVNGIQVVPGAPGYDKTAADAAMTQYAGVDHPYFGGYDIYGNNGASQPPIYDANHPYSQFKAQLQWILLPDVSAYVTK